jgi:hypothetical protein
MCWLCMRLLWRGYFEAGLRLRVSLCLAGKLIGVAFPQIKMSALKEPLGYRGQALYLWDQQRCKVGLAHVRILCKRRHTRLVHRDLLVLCTHATLEFKDDVSNSLFAHIVPRD